MVRFMITFVMIMTVAISTDAKCRSMHHPAIWGGALYKCRVVFRLGCFENPHFKAIVTMYDYDTYGDDDLMGSVEVDSQETFTRKYGLKGEAHDEVTDQQVEPYLEIIHNCNTDGTWSLKQLGPNNFIFERLYLGVLCLDEFCRSLSRSNARENHG